MRKWVRLTLKTARRLVEQELDISAAALAAVQLPLPLDMNVYRMRLGRFTVSVENDWYEKNGLYRLRVGSGLGECITHYYDPASLTERRIAVEQNYARKQ